MKAGIGFRRLGAAAASFAVIMTLAVVVSRATTTFTTPNTALISYSLGPGATSAGITPTASTGVILVGTNTNSTNFSVGSVSLVHISGALIRWAGIEAPPGATITQGGSTSPGTHVVYLDASHQVDVEILSADQIVVHNKATSTQAGTVKLIW